LLLEVRQAEMYSRYAVRLLVILVLVAIIPSAGTLARGGRVIPAIALGYPVNVLIGKRPIGSGFFIEKNPSWYFVTAKHVLFTHNKPHALEVILRSYGKDPDDISLNEFRLNLALLLTNENLKWHPKDDVVAIRVFTREQRNGDQTSVLKFTTGVKSISRSNSGIVAGKLNDILKFNDVPVGNDVYVFGYPSSIGLKNVPQLDYGRPLLQKGIVAGKNREKRSIIIAAAIYKGNSGGPVLLMESANLARKKLRLIGLVSQIIPYGKRVLNLKKNSENQELEEQDRYAVFVNSEYAVVVPTDAILETLW
jgi:hypothetical protein